MSAVTSAPPAAVGDDEVIELRRSNERRGLARPGSAGLLALAFVAVAGAAFLLPSHKEFSLEALLVTTACYVLAARVNFEFGGGWAVPTEPIFVAMWFVLPARLLPLIVCGALVATGLPEVFTRQVPPARLLLRVASSWHAVGPALILYFWARQGPSWDAIPVYVGALGAQFAFDYASAYICTRAVLRLTPLRQLELMAPSYAVDALLAPLGLLVAFGTARHPWALLLVLPVLVMFSTFSKERQRRIDNALELSNAYRGTAMLLGDVIEADDAYTGSHSRDVVDLVLAVADRLELDPTERRRAEFAALLHDVGKVKIPAEIINKAGPLDDAEWELMKTHTVLGEQMLDQIGGLLGEVGRVVRSCHERWDGTGYPDGLAGEEIPLTARIVCACDAWSAMRTDRTYRKSLTLEAAAAELRRCSGTHFDPRVVDALAAAVGV